MAMTPCERKRAQRASEKGYALSRECDWRQQGIKGATYQLYLELIVAQHSACPMCNCPIDSTSPLDHNHTTGEYRAVLCSRCNLLLGKVEAGGSLLLRNAAAYLEAFGAQC